MSIKKEARNNLRGSFCRDYNSREWVTVGYWLEMNIIPAKDADIASFAEITMEQSIFGVLIA